MTLIRVSLFRFVTISGINIAWILVPKIESVKSIVLSTSILPIRKWVVTMGQRSYKHI